MRSKRFFDPLPQKSKTTDAPACIVQIPAKRDVDRMEDMPAGSKECQARRIKNMVSIIERTPDINLRTTMDEALAKYWEALFSAINQPNHRNKLATVLALFHQIPDDDPVLKALLAIHPPKYIEQLILSCLSAEEESIEVIEDIKVNLATFEILIRDLATSLLHLNKIHFSFGLPTHHAFSETASGFCLINKTAVLIKYRIDQHENLIKNIIIGTDINRDNGLNQIVMEHLSDSDICHIDIFDAKVYPHEDHLDIEKELRKLGVARGILIRGDDLGKGVKHWQKNRAHYIAVDLDSTVRPETDTIHPALVFALTTLQEQVTQAILAGKKIAIFLPTGWDSHEDETAYCGKWVNGKKLSAKESHKKRFSDEDLDYFTTALFKLYHNNEDHIAGMYWGLEGGYDVKMYRQQLRNFLEIIKTQLMSPSTMEDAVMTSRA